jgi:hypothetical protein
MGMEADYNWDQRREEEEDKKKRREEILKEPARSWDKGHSGYDPSGHGCN